MLSLLLGALPGLYLRAEAQDAPPRDSVWTVTLPEEIVVTAARTALKLKDAAIPIRVVREQEIRRRGALRLTDLLADEPGLAVVHGFGGAGIQVQGLDSDYTLILIDGQPLVGRTGGTLDLDRIPVADVERIEIVPGPSSSLYGSEALAGVINIITRPADPKLHVTTGLRRQSFGTQEMRAGVSGGRGPLRLRTSYNLTESDGYDLTPESITLTSPGYESHTLLSSLRIDPETFWTARVQSRWARENQNTLVGVAPETDLTEDARQEDWSLGPELTLRPGSAHRIHARGFASAFRTRSILADTLITSTSRFREGTQRIELQYDFFGSASHAWTAGGGITRDHVTADRIKGRSRDMSNRFVFMQHQWAAYRRIQTTLSARMDAHTEYATRISPKAAVMMRPLDTVTLRVSVGSGFKAPRFQQLYMDFTNPTQGYTVVGASDMAEAMDSLQANGQISALLTDPTRFNAIRPEESTSFQGAVTWEPSLRLGLTTSFFYNHIRDLIDTTPVAVKTNGQNVFSYINLNRIRTRGFVTDLRAEPGRGMEVTAGYQYLDTADLDVLDRIEEGVLFTRENGVDRRITRSDYGGLFSRSRHTVTLGMTWTSTSGTWAATLRGQYRSRYGFADANGNLILDADQEYVPAYSLWHVTAMYQLAPNVRLTAGGRNLFDHTNVVQLPSEPGRQVFAGITVDVHP